MTDGSGSRRRAVTLDLWHTLLHLEPKEEERYLREQEDRAAALIATWPARPRAPGEAPPVDPWAAFRSEFRAAAVASQTGFSVPSTVQISVAAHNAGHEARPLEYIQSLGDLVNGAAFRLAPGARELLERLRGSGYRIGLISNTVGEPGRFLQRVCDRLGIGEFIEVWAWSDELPWTKPSPEIFRWCLAQLGVAPGDAVHVGDGASDVEGALAARLRGVILYEGLRDYSPEYRKMFAPPLSSDGRPSARVAYLADIPSALEEIFGSSSEHSPAR